MARFTFTATVASNMFVKIHPGEAMQVGEKVRARFETKISSLGTNLYPCSIEIKTNSSTISS